MIETILEPTIRVRVNHDRTSKGWRCNETTVELNAVPNKAVSMKYIHETMQLVLHELHDVGIAEAERRNRVEGFSA